MMNAAASVTAPRIPDHAITAGTCHGGSGSFRRMPRNNSRGRYVAGNTQSGRARTTAAVTTRP